MHRRPSVAAAAFGLVAPFLFCTIAFGQNPAAPDSIAQEHAPVPEIIPETPQPTLFERVDRGFATAVEWMSRILFYRLGADTREYIIFEHAEHFVRDRGSEGPFIRLDPEGTYELDILDEAAVEELQAEGRLIPGPGGKPYRLGRIGDREIEYVTVTFQDEHAGIPYGQKYVLSDDGLFHRVRKKRSLVSADETLSRERVEELAAPGRLRVDPESAADPQRPWLLREPIGGAPLVVLWLALGAVVFTLYMRGVNVWAFGHAIQVIRGKYDDPTEAGEVTHFQALASALSATVGLGNIAGVTIAMTLGGPGAFFWMMCCGIFGMASKFTECTLGQKYRLVKPDGTVLGGPMRYLEAGLAEIRVGRVSLRGLGVVLAFTFTVMCVLASFGGGNMFQANQSAATLLARLQFADLERLSQLDGQIKEAAQAEDDDALRELRGERAELQAAVDRSAVMFRQIYGLILATLVAVVIIGGIRRIGAAAEKLVPSMCFIYIAACLWIIFRHITQIPELVVQIFTEAFTGEAMGGGLIGVLVIGVQRAAFSNEAGVGSAAIAHSAARTDEPVREGIVALLEPFIDTVVVCSMTALVILITGAWDNNQWIEVEGREGASLTMRAFGSEISWFPWLLSVAVVLFAYSTIISWSYYGERSWERLFGPRSTGIYKALAVICVFIGSIVNLGSVLDFSDMMILSMAFPNILGLFLLAPKVRRDLLDYWRRYKAGEFQEFK